MFARHGWVPVITFAQGGTQARAGLGWREGGPRRVACWWFQGTGNCMAPDRRMPMVVAVRRSTMSLRPWPSGYAPTLSHDPSPATCPPRGPETALSPMSPSLPPLRPARPLTCRMTAPRGPTTMPTWPCGSSIRTRKRRPDTSAASLRRRRQGVCVQEPYKVGLINDREGKGHGDWRRLAQRQGRDARISCAKAKGRVGMQGARTDHRGARKTAAASRPRARPTPKAVNPQTLSVSFAYRFAGCATQRPHSGSRCLR